MRRPLAAALFNLEMTTGMVIEETHCRPVKVQQFNITEPLIVFVGTVDLEDIWGTLKSLDTWLGQKVAEQCSKLT